MKKPWLLFLLIMFALPAPIAWGATTYYIGQFTNSNPSTGAGCGPKASPCATLAEWTQNHRSGLTPGDIVRIARGTYGPVNNANHCIAASPGVLYEGRELDDTELATSSAVIIDLASTPNSAPCRAQFVACNGCNFHNFQLRSLTLRNAKAGAGSPTWFKPEGCSGPGGRCENLTFRYVRFSGSRDDSFGPLIGDWIDCRRATGTPCPGLTRNVLIEDSEFDNSLGDGLMIGDVDGYTIRNTSFHDNGNHFCSPSVNSACPVQDFSCSPNCEDDDGLNVMSGRNGYVVRATGYHNRQGGFDFTRHAAGAGDSCPASTNTTTIERSEAYDNGSYGFGANSCAYNIVFANNIAYGTQRGFNQYNGSCGLRFYNNTVYSTSKDAIEFFQHHTQIDIRNNIFRCNRSGNPGGCVRLGSNMTTAGAQIRFDYNLIDNASGFALSVVDFMQDDCATVVADGDYACNIVGCNSTANDAHADSATGLSSFRNAAYAGLGGSGAYTTKDLWNTTPNFQGVTQLTAANLHLQPNDSLAQNAGTTLADVTGTCAASGRCSAGLWGKTCTTNSECAITVDYDLDSRPQNAIWDIGADEVITTGGPSTPTNLRIAP